MTADTASYGPDARGGRRRQGDRCAGVVEDGEPPAARLGSPALPPPALSEGLDLPPPRSSSHLRVRCLVQAMPWNKCLYPRPLTHFWEGPSSGGGEGLPLTHPGKKNNQPTNQTSGTWSARASSCCANLPWVGTAGGQGTARRGGTDLGATRALLRGRHRRLGEPPGRRRDGVLGMARGVGDASFPLGQPRGCCPPTPPGVDAPRDTRPKGTGLCWVFHQRISLRRSLFRGGGGGVRGKAQHGAERGGGRRRGAQRPE